MPDACCERRRYLKTTPPGEALAIWLAHPACRRDSGSETIPVVDAQGRIAAEAVIASRSVPHFHCSAMDGVALRAELSFGASEVRPVTLAASEYVVVDTGDPIPAEHDSVVMVEDVRWLPDGGIELAEPATPWQHIRLAGEDAVATEMLAPAGTSLGPAEMSSLLAAGVTSVSVRRRPQVVIIPTGDEIVPPDAGPLPDGAIPETNGMLLAGMIREWGGEARIHGIVPDHPDALRRALQEAVEASDLVLINAGSSAGRGDWAPGIIEECGELLVHGVAMMPGKPLALGAVSECPVAGVPGYPVSAWAIAREFIHPLLRQMQGLSPRAPRITIAARVARRVQSRIGSEELLRVKVARVGGRLTAAPLPRGASILSSVVRADGILRLASGVEGVEAGQAVDIELLRPLDEIESALLCIGSHDMLLDILSDLLGRRLPGARLASAHVGSLGGLVALRRGECHLAGSHLMDEETGEYNLTWIDRQLAGEAVEVVHLAMRTQGLITAPGNPLRIEGLGDLVRDEILYINRQRGSGTRQLLDYRLRQASIDPSQVRGYHRELYTHLAVASAVASGAADAGLGVMAAARALRLSFIPVASEQYDLVIRSDAMELPSMKALLNLLTDPVFRARVDDLGGYDVSRAGELLRSSE